MAKNTLQDLRDHLFAQLEALNDKENPLDLDRAKAVCETASQIIDSARVTVKYLEVTGKGEAKASQFFNVHELPAPPVTVTSRKELAGKPNGRDFT